MIRKPLPLTDDADSPVLTSDGVEVLILRTLMYCERQYTKAMMTLRKRYGDLRPKNQPRRRPIARNHRRFIRQRDLAGIVDDAT
jgi:hypothetical protein